MRVWVIGGVVAALLLLIVGLALFSFTTDDDSSSGESTEVSGNDGRILNVDDPNGVRGEGVIRTTPGAVVDSESQMQTVFAERTIDLTSQVLIDPDEATVPGTPSDAQLAETDDDPELPGVFHGSQGRGHFFEDLAAHAMTPYCNGVRTAPDRDVTVEVKTVGPVNRCYETNPPSSGRHLGVRRNVDIGGGLIINIPPDPDVYPPEIEIPRDAIPHILEHAGVFVGYHCADGDTACEDVVQLVADIVNDRIDNNNDRVVMARDTDLPIGEIGLASWTRVLNLTYEDYDEDTIVDFIATHSCRYDPEGFC